MTDSQPRDDRRSKVGRAIAENGLEGIGEELERRWTASGDDRWSLRELASYFNKRLLEAKLESVGHRPRRTVDRTYRILTSDDPDPASKVAARRDLEGAGVDVEELLDEFVSHQAVHTYLTKYREVSPPDTGSGDSLDTVKRAINRLKNRTAAVTSSNVERLRNRGDLDIGEVEVLVSVEAYCTECGSSYPIGDLLETRRCDCPGE